MKRYWKLLPLVLLVGGCIANVSTTSTTRGNQNEESPIVEFYNQRCAGCHGIDGHPNLGNTPDFTEEEFQSQHSDEDLTKSIADGKPPRMPAFKSKLDDAQVKAMVAHVRSMAKKESNDQANK